MEKSVSSRLRVPSIVAAAVIVLSSFALAVPAHADTNPTNPADPKTPVSVSADGPVPLRASTPSRGPTSSRTT